jgi:hypothetical protein
MTISRLNLDVECVRVFPVELVVQRDNAGVTILIDVFILIHAASIRRLKRAVNHLIIECLRASSTRKIVCIDVKTDKVGTG